MRRSAILFTGLLVAACAGQEPEPAETAEAAATAPAQTPAATGASPEISPPAAIAVIPERFHGIWDKAGGPCDPASVTRTEIAERGVTFYESHGAVTALAIDSPEKITVDLAMQGEGEKWTLKRSFTLSGDSTVLTPSGGSQPGAFHPLRRCA